MFQLWDHRRRRGEPPQRFSPSDTLHMTERDWQAYWGHVTAHMIEVSNAFERMTFDYLRLRTMRREIGGEHDGAQGTGDVERRERDT